MVEKNSHVASLEEDAPSVEEEYASFSFLATTSPDQTFRVAQEHLEEIFGDLTDKKGRNLLEHYGEAECLSVLARVEYIAQELQAALVDSDILESESIRSAVSDKVVEKVRRFLIDLTPLGSTAPDAVWSEYAPQVREHDTERAKKYGYESGGVYLNPEWDQLDRASEKSKNQPETRQEINFYQRLLTHVMMTTIFVEKLGTQINAVLELANRDGTALDEGAFGYLKEKNGQYRTIDLNRMKVRMLVHDIGRWATHHPVLHETLPDLLAHYLGVTPPLIQYEFNHQERYFSGTVDTVNPQNIPIEESLFHFIDFIAKRDDESDLESVKVRRLDQLAEHAIARASGYNGKLKEFWEAQLRMRLEGGTLSLEDLIRKALEILSDSHDPGQAEFYKMELQFLQNILPFLGTQKEPGLFQTVGTSLEEQIAFGEQEFEQQIDSGELLGYQDIPVSSVVATSITTALTGK